MPPGNHPSTHTKWLLWKQVFFPPKKNSPIPIHYSYTVSEGLGSVGTNLNFGKLAGFQGIHLILSVGYSFSYV